MYLCHHLYKISPVNTRKDAYFVRRPAIPVHFARCRVHTPAPIFREQEVQGNNIKFASFLALTNFPKQSFPASRVNICV